MTECLIPGSLPQDLTAASSQQQAQQQKELEAQQQKAAEDIEARRTAAHLTDRDASAQPPANPTSGDRTE